MIEKHEEVNWEHRLGKVGSIREAAYWHRGAPFSNLSGVALIRDLEVPGRFVMSKRLLILKNAWEAKVDLGYPQ